MASTFLAAEVTTSSSFLGASVAVSKAVSCKSRVSMAYNREELERKPLALLRALARQQGVAPVGRQQIIDGLMKKGDYSYSPSYAAATPASYYSTLASSAAPVPGDLASKSIGELRALAKARGLRGDTKAELLKLLGSAPAAAAAPYSAAVSIPAPTPVPSGLPAGVLERKSLSELRAMARSRGVRGDTKAELVRLLAAPDTFVPSAPSSTSYSSSTNGAYSSSPPVASSSNGASSAVLERQLQVKSLSQLRAMASVRGVRGTTKAELIKQLAAFV